MSISQRLFLISFLILGIIALGIAAGLSKAHALSVETLIRERLKLMNYSLLSQADNFKGEIYLPKNVDDERFNLDDSALLAQVYDAQGKLAWRSVSASLHNLELPQPDAGQWLFGLAVDEQGNNYYSLSYGTSWPDEQGNHSQFVFSVLEEADDYQIRQKNIYVLIAAATAAILLTLLSLQWLIVRLSLKPLKKLSADIQSLNHGNRDKLASSYSKDLNPMALDLNLMIENEQRQRQRYHDRMADLSHSLKTPLSVLRGLSHEAEENSIDQQRLSKNMNKQLRRMRDIVDYQLQRAVTGNQKASFVAVSIKTEVNAIVNALQKVYYDKNVQTKIEIHKDLSVYADEQDMAEVIGNLCDNAFKYSINRVGIHAEEDDNTWSLTISDDGPGIPSEEQDSIFERGVRLDSQAEGQGLGLALVREILASYQATLSIGISQWQGAKINVKFPKNNGQANH